MLADAEEIDADLVGQDRLVDDVADNLRGRERLAVGAGSNVAERVEAEFERMRHGGSGERAPRLSWSYAAG